jgi:peptidoglycan/xylan/chitin deacetylase (PgdA/CDA1 family)
VAFPLLKKYGMPATFFVPTSYVDSGELLPLDRLDSAIAHAGAKRVTVDAGGGARVSLEMGSAGQRQKSAVQLHRIYKGLEGEGRSTLVDGVAAALGYASRRDVPPLGEHMRLMAWEQLAGMSREGMSIGSHTHSHVIMTRIGREEAEFELAESKRLIEKATGRDCRVFCYPNGRYGHDGNAATDRLVEKAGYEGSVYMQGGINTGRSRPYSLARYAVGAETSLRDLANHLASIWPRLKAIASRSRN